jgi:hypothetical protein
MDASYERNIADVLTTVISNVITMVLLGTMVGIKDEDISDDHLLKKKDDITSYIGSLFLLLVVPIGFVSNAANSLCYLIRKMSEGKPYKYIRLLSEARYFIGYDLQYKFVLDQKDGKRRKLQRTYEG